MSNVHRPSVVSIGNFDGVHLGHQHVIQTLLHHAERLQAASTVITFEPLAKEFFMPDSVLRLTTLEQRTELLCGLGVDRVLCIPFTSEFAARSPEGFVEDVLINALGIRYLSVGDDFRFGKNRTGDFNLLLGMGAEHGFEVHAHDTFKLGGERVSSGRVRAALAAGDFETAGQLLGRAYAISGLVSRGQQLGRTLNFPTANIVLPDFKMAVNGVYAVEATLDGQVYQGVANVGKRPTVDGKENRLEVHLFDFDDDIYEQALQVCFVKKIRDEQKFESIDALKIQIGADAEQARLFFAGFDK